MKISFWTDHPEKSKIDRINTMDLSLGVVVSRVPIWSNVILILEYFDPPLIRVDAKEFSLRSESLVVWGFERGQTSISAASNLPDFYNLLTHLFWVRATTLGRMMPIWTPCSVRKANAINPRKNGCSVHRAMAWDRSSTMSISERCGRDVRSQYPWKRIFA